MADGGRYYSEDRGEKRMSEYIVRETGYPGAIKQEIVGELVRCGECKYGRPYSYFADKYTCEKEHDCGDYTTHADWFCADGERKGEE